MSRGNSMMSERIAPNRGASVHGIWANAVIENFHEVPPTDRSQFGAWCYTDRLSYAGGATIRIHTCTTAARYDLRLYRDGVEETEVFRQEGLAGQFYATPAD